MIPEEAVGRLVTEEQEITMKIKEILLDHRQKAAVEEAAHLNKDSRTTLMV